MISPAMGADPVTTPLTLTAPAGLPASATMPMTWSTAEGAWIADVQPNSVNYMGNKYTKYNVDMTTVTTDASGNFSFKTTIPRDFGSVHDVYVVSNGAAVAHGGFQYARTLSISPKSGPIGTPITITYTGMGANLYTGGVSVLWDNSYAGVATGIWTGGTAVFTIRAAGPVGTHYIAATTAIGVQYMNIKQSPVPWGKVLSNGIAKADTSPTPELRDGSGVPKSTFKVGEEFTIAMKGVGWTQLDNTLAVTYDNSFIGYGCGFNSNGYMVVHLIAAGAPGTHIIDLHPVLYIFQPSFANTPYGGGTRYSPTIATCLAWPLAISHLQSTSQ